MNTAAARRDVTSKYSRPATLYICFDNNYRVAIVTKAGQSSCDGGARIIADYRGHNAH